jgi:DNA modification methylase
MSVATFYIGDVFEEMAKIPDESVDCLITSPPFLALRSYLPAATGIDIDEDNYWLARQRIGMFLSDEESDV